MKIQSVIKEIIIGLISDDKHILWIRWMAQELKDIKSMFAKDTIRGVKGKNCSVY